MDPASEFLEHYGVKGMRWGVRSKGSVSKGKVSDTASTDAKRAAELSSKAKSSSVSSLSNMELKDLNNRLQLEQTYSQLTTKTSPSTFKAGQDLVKETLSVGKTVNEVIAFSNSPAGALIKETLNTRSKGAHFKK